MADRRLGCLSIFLFVALCASVLLNFFLALAAFQRLGGVVREPEPILRFREVLLERGRFGGDKIVLITLRGLISSSIPGNARDSMVEDLRAEFQDRKSTRLNSSH